MGGAVAESYPVCLSLEKISRKGAEYADLRNIFDDFFVIVEDFLIIKIGKCEQ